MVAAMRDVNVGGFCRLDAVDPFLHFDFDAVDGDLCHRGSRGSEAECRISAVDAAAGEISRLRIRESFHKRGEYSAGVGASITLAAWQTLRYRSPFWTPPPEPGHEHQPGAPPRRHDPTGAH